MNTKNLYVLVMTITVLLLAAGVAGAVPGWTAVLEPNATAVSAPDVTAAVTNGIGYQGRLTSATGTPLNGTYAMRFVVYDADVAGSALWDSGNLNIAVENGLFNVKLGVDVVDFDGQALWLSIIVDGETLSPRQEILPAPYALSLRPGADIVGDNIAAADAIVASYAPATGTALHAESNGGAGLVSTSQNSYAVWGASDDSFGGYFTSVEGYGIRVETTGADHYDHGAYVSSVEGYAVYAQSSNNQALRGEAGDMSGISSALGRVGVVGMGQNRGVHGASSSGLGVYGTSNNSTGVFGNTSRADRNFGLYTNDNLFSFNINLAGSVMQVMQNSGDVLLAPGDVVVFSGVNRTGTDMPVVQVRHADAAHSTAVAGVVHSRFTADALGLDLDTAEGSARLAELTFTPAGEVAPGEYLLVVVQGMTQVNVGSVGANEINVGDLLATGPVAGTAGRASTVSVNGMDTAVPGTVLGKALEPIEGPAQKIYVYVTLQ